MENLMQSIANTENDLINWRRNFHQIPELGEAFPKTIDFLTTILNFKNIEYRFLENINAGIEVKFDPHLKNTNSDAKAKTVMCEIAGDNIIEETGLFFRSNNGWMHSKANDANMAVTLGLINILHDYKQKLDSVVYFIFLPLISDENLNKLPDYTRTDSTEEIIVNYDIAREVDGVVHDRGSAKYDIDEKYFKDTLFKLLTKIIEVEPPL